MDKQLRDNIQLLIQDGEEIEHVNFSVLLSFKRNAFFAHLENYINFYSRIRMATKNKNPQAAVLEKIPELHFKDYSLSTISHFVLLTLFPVSFIIFLIQWKYIKDLKRKLTIGLNEFNSLLKK